MVAVLREDGRHPDPIIHSKTHKPAEQQIVLELLAQHALTAHRIEDLDQERPQQLLRWNRWAARPGVHGVEERRGLIQDRIDEATNRPQRMVRRHSILQSARCHVDCGHSPAA
jgi:hypothetical protein